MINNKLYRNGLNRLKRANGRYEVFGRHGASGLRGLRRACLSFIIYHLLFIISLTCPFSVQAQIRIGGNVYGGGNEGEVKGSTKVTVKSGDIGAVTEAGTERPLKNPLGKVFGGARMANVGGHTFVHIDGDDTNANGYILINQVFGGNDIAGTIGSAAAVGETVPSELTGIRSNPLDTSEDAKLDSIDNTWNSYVRISTKTSYTAAEIAAASDGDPAYGKTAGVAEHYTEKEIAAAAKDPEAAAYGKKTSDIKPPTDAKKVYIGQLFGGGNGDFDYAHVQNSPVEGKTTHYIYNRSDTKHESPLAQVVTDNGEVGFQEPILDKTYLEINGGSIVYAYGGGNNATINKKTVIHVDNPSAVTNHIFVDKDTWVENTSATAETETIKDLLITERFKEMGINTTFSKPSSGAYQVGRFFGGNNLAEMHIRPSWNLLSGKIRNLYSGGNKGKMTPPEGLLLEIPETSSLIVDNLYGGCRMSDVMPTVNDVYTPCTNLTRENYPEADLKQDYKFPDELSARTLVRGGHIHNVYGGNDVTGTVYGGNAVGIYTTVYGNVYGGGNGNYPYTDIAETFTDDEVYGDFLYPVPSGMASALALNAFRPNAEQVSIRLKGSAGGGGRPNYTVIRGSVFVGGNCASLATKKKSPLVELKIGSYVIADSVYLGNNGAGMIDEDYLKLYAGKVDNDGKYTAGEGRDFSSLTLTDENVFRRYMKGVCMDLQPAVVFDDLENGDPETYLPNTSYVGSFYCGGNVGSMSIPGKNTYRVTKALNIFEKFVGGCNKAYVPAGDYNAAYDGGVIGADDEWEAYTDGDDNIKDRLEINLENLTITPLRWNADETQLIWNTQKRGLYISTIEAGTELEKGDVYYDIAPLTERTVTGSETLTVGENDKFFKKREGDSYTQIVAGTELAVGSKYYEYTATSSNEHTVTAETFTPESTVYSIDEDFVEVPNNDVDEDTRLLGGNVYGGCFDSGIVNGNVTININEDVLKRDEIFGNGTGPYGNRASGVDFEAQRDDLDAMTMVVFGAGSGKDTEIWGSSTVNLNHGYAFQVLGGGERGMVGKPIGYAEAGDKEGEYATKDGKYTYYTTNGKRYSYDRRYSSTVNLNGTETATDNTTRVPDLAETEYIYAAGKEGDVCGNSYVYLGNGRIYDAFAGACDANILGHSEAYIGRQPDGSGGYKDGFPWIQDIVYGGNDFGGTIFGNYESDYNFENRIKDYSADKAKQLEGNPSNSNPGLLKSAAYVEYNIGRVDTIFGGNYAFYDYNSGEYAGCEMPYLKNTFVNIRPKSHDRNHITGVFGGGTGYPKNRKGDESQDHSYVLIDIPDGVDKFKSMEVFGAGSYNGLGMRYIPSETFAKTFNRDLCSSVIDLLHGEVGYAYGGSYNEGVTARTVVNVPEKSTIKINKIFGGAYGTQILPPCDVIQAIVNYKSEDALVGTIYGGNNNERRSLFTQVNISSPVWSDKSKGYLATVFGAGRGIDTWSEHTQVNLLKGAKVFEVYGGGEMGHVLNAESVQRYMWLYQKGPSDQISAQAPYWSDPDKWDIDGGMRTVKAAYKDEWDADWKDAWRLGKYYEPNDDFDNYFNAFAGLRNTSLVRKAEIDERDYSAFSAEAKDIRDSIYSTNVIINEGAEVLNYAYGGGLGDSSEARTGDVYGHTYIALLGGSVTKDIYAAGTSGAVNDIFGVGAYYYNTSDPDDENNNPYGFTASATAYIKGGTCRNVYGGGWKGNVGKHTGAISETTAGDIPGSTYVVIGDVNGSSYTSGIPAIQRNAYGGGEGGAVYGTAHVKLNNGYIGYQYNSKGSDVADTKDIDERYEEKIADDTKDLPNTFLAEAGCLFGGGYIDNSYVDKTLVTLYGGHVRSSLFGGGEIAAIGRGEMQEKPGGKDYMLKGIYRPGKTNIEMYGGHVHQNVFGGGRGYDNLGRHGTLNCDGYIFGQTEVHIHGGEIGTKAGVADGDGNVFGGSDIGVVYSAYEKPDGTFGKGVKGGVRYDDLYEGYYYQHAWEDDGAFVTVEVPTYYTAAEAAEYNTEHSLSPGAEGSKKEGDQKGTKTERQFTEDCKVLIEPNLKVLAKVTIDGHPYVPGQYVPIDTLNMLHDKETDKDRWSCLDQTGIIIHNAVFAGGNALSGSTTTSANTNTVFGNATASIHDIFHRDMITLGTRHTGGLYGDGNLTLVDGYRELNITNYGTDYYSIAKEIDIKTYRALPEREAAYYELNYTCMKECQDKLGTIYTPKNPSDLSSKAATITADDMLDLFLVYNESTKVYTPFEYGGKAVLRWNDTRKEWEPNPAAGYWEESGVLPVYAGRLMNSIQRADLCGVFGSRMVMQGAQDRVPEEADYTNYTINRVREVSLNKMDSKIGSDLAIKEDVDKDAFYKKHRHGNYFGIYNVVNYLGSLTSDVLFTEKRKTDNTSNDALYKRTLDEGGAYGTATFYDWKKENIKNKTRNNGSSYNKVALASGVYLEITTEKSTGDDLYEKVWGPITGIVELDLINVATGIGGGFVYAKNVHGIPSKTWAVNTTLTALNEDAATKWDYTYDTTDDAAHQMEWETSGNFIHSTQTIIDDCYNISNRYYGTGKMPAHYWYIKGTTYVYDQYISAYTGQANAYSETVDIPLTIAAASHGKLRLLNVMPNRYAYYAKPGSALGDEQKMIINGKTYYKNDPISYWDWYLLSKYEKELFVEKTYLVKDSCYINSKYYAPGDVLLPDEYNTLSTKANTNMQVIETGEAAVPAVQRATKDGAGNPVAIEDEAGNPVYAAFDFVFRESNNVDHDKGYILTYEVNNPAIWDNWYTPKTGTSLTGKIDKAAYDVSETKTNYEDGPTYRLKATTGGAVLGQHEYEYGNLIPEAIYYTYEGKSGDPTYPGIKRHISEDVNGKQATFEKAYIVKNKITIVGDDQDTYYNPGTAVPYSIYKDYSSSDFDDAYICTKTIQVTKEDVIYKDSKMSKTKAEQYVSDVNTNIEKLPGITNASNITQSQIDALSDENKKLLNQMLALKSDLQTYLVQAYFCTSKPAVDEDENPIHYYYGGDYYESGHNYRGLAAWSSMSEADRQKFTFNYDALDLLIDKTYSGDEGKKYQYDGPIDTYASDDDVKNASTGNKAGYSITQSVDYTAEYNSSSPSPTLTNTVTVKRGSGTTTTQQLQKGDELSRDVFENQLVNERRHFAPVAAKTATLDPEGSGEYLAYVVHTPFQVGSTPYAVGETISRATYKSLPNTEQGYVTEFKFSATDHSNEAVYYYCRESYTMGTEVTAIETIPGAGGGISDGEVQLGTLINSTNYGQLKNEQEHFTIHGVSPTETSTFYVSRESDIYDLSKEKIITVIYKYDYDEADEYGNITPMSERHVLNIHLTFKSGVPIVEDITPPDIILPGDFTSLREPTVTPGAYEVTGGGWELFATQREAESHTNGIEYNPTFDPLYWYQDDYYVAYYAKSYLGRTYSNAVPVSVANYHDMKKVMDAKTHHYYIDHKNVQREPKIYINDYSKSKENGLDLFKDLYDLSLLHTGDPSDGHVVTTDAKGLISSGSFEGHALLNSRVKGGDNLEFFMRTDIDHTKKWVNNPAYDPNDPETDPEFIQEDNPWTPIASGVNDQCFSGVFHGDGHTISGLAPAESTTGSLFGRLCGSVYNLGVMGSFTGAGIADTGDGYVESCWVKSSAAASGVQPTYAPLPSGLTKPYPIFGVPTGTSGYQVVNSYYSADNKAIYTTKPNDEEIDYSGDSKGSVTSKPAKAFYNGELAYELNNFYLYKRYSDKNTNTSNKYSYFTVADDNSLTLHEDIASYDSHPDFCSSGYSTLKYVENRFADGDYRFAGGVIPEDEDERHREKEVTVDGKKQIVDKYYPIWPDDYIFFGQKLTYGWAAEAHQPVPTAVARADGRLSQGTNANRVYRAPAYYRSKDMSVYHFNPTAYLAFKSNDGTLQVTEKPMTAIDFAGHNGTNEVDGTYGLGLIAASGGRPQTFYPPLLDDDGLLSISNCDETQNLLVYAPAASGESGYVNSATQGVLSSYFVDPDYESIYYDNSKGYRLVAENENVIYGHLVQSDLTATNDHLLVDKQDFNCPIAYAFDSSHRMWYQRKPQDNEYVDRLKGWQGISLPFTAELVTTNQKGEITHFYGGSTPSTNSEEKIGHEYWLRELVANSTLTPQSSKVLQATFNYPTAAGENKNYTNTFLWDYYYENTDRHNQHDAHDDTYLQYRQYYKTSHSYKNYSFLTAAKPYILGLPGMTYYEFDLSGKFEAENTASPTPERLAKQTISFVSNTREHIGVSDDEMTGTTGKYSGNDYIFKPNYMNQTLAADENYVLNSDGNAFVQLSNVPESYTTEGSTYTFANEEAFNTEVAKGALYTNDAGTTELTWTVYNASEGSRTATYYKRTGVTPSKNDQNHVTPSLTAFRPYFFTQASAPVKGKLPSSIVFNSSTGEEFEEGPESALDGTLEIFTRGRNIITRSHMTEPVAIRIVNIGGVTIASFVLPAGQTIETPVYAHGAYIVNKKKVFVR